MSSIRPRFLAASVGAVITLAACGSDAAVSEPTSGDEGDAVDLAEVRAALDDIEFESEGVPSGPLLGDEALSDDGDTAADPASEDCEALGDCGDGAPIEPDEPNQQSGEAREPVAFQPSPAWAAFCTVLAELEEREFPTDPTEALRVVDIWFGLLQPYVPAEIGADFAQLDDALDAAVQANDITLLETVSPELDAAAERIGDATDANCAGR